MVTIQNDMTNEEAINHIENMANALQIFPDSKQGQALLRAIKALEQITDLKDAYDKGYKDGQEALAFHYELCKEESEPCEDVIGRAEAMTEIMMFAGNVKPDEEDIYIKVSDAVQLLRELPSVNPQEPKTGHCKDCKYFEYDSVAKVDGIPLIVAHEICNKWGNGCKTREDGYCFLFEPQESEG